MVDVVFYWKNTIVFLSEICISCLVCVGKLVNGATDITSRVNYSNSPCNSILS